MTLVPPEADRHIEDRLLPWRKVKDLTGLSRTTAWRLQKVGDFPVPVAISPGRVGVARERAYKVASVANAKGQPRGRSRRFHRGPSLLNRNLAHRKSSRWRPSPTAPARGNLRRRATTKGAPGQMSFNF